jgi:hypothetical protein
VEGLAARSLVTAEMKVEGLKKRWETSVKH